MEEAEELRGIVADIAASGGAAAGERYDRFKAILTKYQEQPQLLDEHLEAIVQPLALLLRRTALASSAGDTAVVVQGVCRLLQVLVSVRGHKTVVRFFPHEAADLERVLQVLDCVTSEARAAAGSGGRWESQAVLLLWLSMLVLSPFDLAILDSSLGADGSSGGASPAAGAAAAAAAGPTAYPPLAARVMELCQGFLQQPGAVREMAALLLARLLTRPDMPAGLDDFLAWQREALAAARGPAAVFLLPGVLQTLALIFKLGRREQLLRLAPALWDQLAGLLADEAASGLASNALARKLAVKLAQRVGLALLPPRLGGWRHVRAAPDLGSNLAASAAGGNAAPLPLSPRQQQQQAAEPEVLEVPEQLEDIIGVLLGSCSDRDTVVRWSAAKGVGRLASCLPQPLAAEVVQGVLALLSPAEPDTAWHGGCLAIAELARRSILPPDELEALSPLLTAALAYDVRRGPHSVGAHVRDAAAYVCWALARSYEPQQLSGCVAALACSLLVVTCYDREVNCRRAAAAAFQEAVGRLGSFPHGLDILAVADYYTVGNTASAYLRVAPAVARFSEYTQALTEHLLCVKLRHWDKALRGLAAMGLAALAPAAAEQLAATALPRLLALTTADALEVRTGAVLGVAELLPALAAAGLQQLPSQAAAGIVDVLCQLEAARLYRGKGGELMREAAARLVQQLATAVAGLPVVPLCGFSGSSASGRRHAAERRLEHRSDGGQQQQRQGVASPDSGGAAALADSEEEEASDADSDDAGPSSAQQEQRQRQLALPLTPAYHAAAVRLLLDCLSHAQASIRASGAAALRAHSRAFQEQQLQPQPQLQPQQEPQQGDEGSEQQAGAVQLLRGVVEHCCSRLLEREAAPAARCGAAAALGVLPRSLVADQGSRVLTVLADTVQAPLDPQAGFDIETRIAAVSSLAQLTQELLASSSSSSSSSTALSAAAAAHAGRASVPPAAPAAAAAAGAGPAVPVSTLQECVCPVLLAALADYTQDNRGDVGSWVREAAMEGLTELVLLLGTMQEQQQHEQQQPAPAGWPAADLAALHQQLARRLVAGLLRQSLERIARLRESALISLQRLLAQPATAAAVPGAADITAALPGDAVELAGVASLACVPRLGALLRLPWHRLPLLEGLVASIGGVDASLAKAASAALLGLLGGSSQDVQDLRVDVAEQLLQLWQREAGSARLSLPLVKTAALLITHADLAAVPAAAAAAACGAAALAGQPAADAAAKGCANGAAGAGCDGSASPAAGSASFAWGVLALLKAELRGCGDVGKLLDGAALLAQLVCVPDCGASAIQTVLILLANRFPKVRRCMAEQLYLQLLAVQTEADLGSDAPAGSLLTTVPPDDLEAALDVLLVSAWDGPLEGVRAAREELAARLHVEIKARRVARAAPSGDAARGARPAGAGESYQSLLDDAARGGGY